MICKGFVTCECGGFTDTDLQVVSDSMRGIGMASPHCCRGGRRGRPVVGDWMRCSPRSCRCSSPCRSSRPLEAMTPPSAPGRGPERQVAGGAPAAAGVDTLAARSIWAAGAALRLCHLHGQGYLLRMSIPVWSWFAAACTGTAAESCCGIRTAC